MFTPQQSACEIIMFIFRWSAMMALSNYLFLIMFLSTLLAGPIHSVAAFNLVRMNSMFHFCRCRRKAAGGRYPFSGRRRPQSAERFG
jgi:hypothetical protein